MELKNYFTNPPKEYSLVPFWFWNDELKEEHLIWQMDEMKEKGIHEFIIHARKGLSVEYLSEEWFQRIECVISHAEKLDMNLWLYDEDNFPSGYAGGKVLAENPDYCGKHLKLFRKKVDSDGSIDLAGDISGKYKAVFYKKDDKYYNVTNSIINGILMVTREAADEILVFYEDYTLWHPAYSDGYYVDLLNGEATKTFIKFTHEEYKKRFGQYFGTVIKGFFIDEPGFYNNLCLIDEMNDRETIPWTGEFPAYFSKINGYDILDFLPLIWFDNGHQSLSVRNDYYKTLEKMYRENFLGMLKDYCEQNGVKLIGHMHYEEFMRYHVITQGDFFKAQNGLSFAGTDRIDTNEKKISEKITSSAGHVYGKERVMSETYALCGWGLTLQQMKHWANWQYVRGVNMMVPHAFFSSIEGERKDECPPSEFYQNPYWKHFAHYSDYISRLSYILSQGSHVANIAVYYPISSAYEKITPINLNTVDDIDKILIELSDILMENQLDFDFINTDAIMSADIHNGSLQLNGEGYRMLVFAGCTNLDIKELDKLIEFAKTGGIIIFSHCIPGKALYQEDQDMFEIRMRELLKMSTVHTLTDMKTAYGMGIYKAYTYTLNEMPYRKWAEQYGLLDFKLLKEDRWIKYLHRKIGCSDVYYVINESGDKKENKFEIYGTQKVECWDAETGKTSVLKASYVNGKTRVDLKLNPYDGRIFYCEDKEELDDKTEYEDDNKLTAGIQCYEMKGQWKLKIDGQEVTTDLGSWTEIGFSDFSGESEYCKSFILTEEQVKGNFILDLGDVRDCAELWVNGMYSGSRVWHPYIFDISKVLKAGMNDLVIKVCNTLSNSLEGIPQTSGILGEVKLIRNS